MIELKFLSEYGYYQFDDAIEAKPGVVIEKNNERYLCISYDFKNDSPVLHKINELYFDDNYKHAFFYNYKLHYGKLINTFATNRVNAVPILKDVQTKIKKYYPELYL